MRAILAVWQTKQAQRRKCNAPAPVCPGQGDSRKGNARALSDDVRRADMGARQRISRASTSMTSPRGGVKVEDDVAPLGRNEPGRTFWR